MEEERAEKEAKKLSHRVEKGEKGRKDRDVEGIEEVKERKKEREKEGGRKAQWKNSRERRKLCSSHSFPPSCDMGAQRVPERLYFLSFLWCGAVRESYRTNGIESIPSSESARRGARDTLRYGGWELASE